MKITDGLKKFKVVRCKKCQCVGITEACGTYKCASCRKTTKMSMKPKGLLLTHFGVDVLYHSDLGKEARDVFLKIQADKLGVGDASFYSFKQRKTKEE